jgi:16S rRNA (guanine527-N7)-methyltransferase
LPYLPSIAHSLLDLGSGGGLPGIPIKIARPDIRVTLLESGRMKGLFLQHVTKVLGLEDLQVRRARAEDISKEEDFVGYDVVVCRAVGALPLLWKLSRPLLKPTGYLLAFKGPGAKKEWELEKPENIVVNYHKARVPVTERERLFVEVRTKS